jgi:hypothetical protein
MFYYHWVRMHISQVLGFKLKKNNLVVSYTYLSIIKLTILNPFQQLKA